MTSFEYERRKRFIINCLYISLIVLILWLVGRYLAVWIFPFLLAFLLAMLVQPAVAFLHNRLHMKRRAAGVFCILLLSAFLLTLLTLSITKIVQELLGLLKMLPALITSLSNALEGLSGSITGWLDGLPKGLANRMIDGLTGFEDQLVKFSSISSGVFSFALNVLTRVPGLLISLIITVVAACFISMDYLEIRSFILRQLPEKYQGWAIDLKRFFFVTIGKLIRAYTCIIMITFAELAIGLWLIGVKYAVLIAAIIALIDILPVFGTGTVMLPWAVIGMLAGNVRQGLCLLLLYGVITVVRNIIEPKLVAGNLGLHPLATLMVMIIGANVMGVSGVLLFPLGLILLKHLQDTGKIRLWK